METMETLQPESQSLPVVKEPPGSQQPGRVRCQRCGIAVPWQVPLIRHCGRPTCQVKSSGTHKHEGQCNICAIYCSDVMSFWQPGACSQNVRDVSSDVTYSEILVRGMGRQSPCWAMVVHCRSWSSGQQFQLWLPPWQINASTPRLYKCSCTRGWCNIWHQKTYQTFHKLRHLRIRDAHKNRLLSTTLLHHVTSCSIYVMQTHWRSRGLWGWRNLAVISFKASKCPSSDRQLLGCQTGHVMLDRSCSHCKLLLVHQAQAPVSVHAEMIYCDFPISLLVKGIHSSFCVATKKASIRPTECQHRVGGFWQDTEEPVFHSFSFSSLTWARKK